MCGINGILINSQGKFGYNLNHSITVMNKLIKHRGPDDDGIWIDQNNKIGLGHTRLSIIDLSHNAHQPFQDNAGNILVFNGEIYNYIELREQLKDSYQFKTKSDTEVILAAYHKYGIDCLKYFDGMFSFAIWNQGKQSLFIARDRLGIKPLYYYKDNNAFYFSSEIKAVLPFIEKLAINKKALTEYLVFQYPLAEELLFDNVHQLPAGEYLYIKDDRLTRQKYWDASYSNHNSHEKHSVEEFKDLFGETIKQHLRSDVPVGVYLSGGIDSSLCAVLAHEHSSSMKYAVNGRFVEDKSFDESRYAQDVAASLDLNLDIQTIVNQDFEKHIRKIIYHLDYPIAGPGSFAQYMVSEVASRNVKVMLGGQGGDELFGGYARYLLMYFGEVINLAIDNNPRVNTLSPKPNNILEQLALLKQYKPLFEQFMKKDCFAGHDRRYYNLINRVADLSKHEVDIHELPLDSIYEKYANIFNSINSEDNNVLNKVMHFDLKCSLPALLHVEDRVSMAHGLESRVPFVDHKVVEFANNLSLDIKFNKGEMKSFLKQCFGDSLPSTVVNRKDKMGFPVPINQWAVGPLKDFIKDVMSTSNSKTRPFVNYEKVLNNLELNTYSRKLWGFLSLELWFQEFFDKHSQYRKLLNQETSIELL